MLARILNGAISAATALISPNNPDLAEVTVAVSGLPVMAACPPKATILPILRSIIPGNTALIR